MYQPREHQVHEAQFWVDHPRMFNTSDPGTGKSYSTLEGYRRSIKGRLLVAAPLTILRPSWGADIDKFMPGFTWAVAHGSEKKRRAAFESGADIVLINHDGVKWLADNLPLLAGFSHMAVDEFTAFKNRSAARSKALLHIASYIEYLAMLSGTPNSNGVLDLWHPAYLVDGGQRLGRKFFEYRASVCTPTQVGPQSQMIRWDDKPGALEMVTQLLSDVTVRHTFEECNDIPPNHRLFLRVDMPAQIMAMYRQLENEAVLEHQNGLITALHAGAKAKKILQLLSGAVYGEAGVVKVHNERHELVLSLIEQRESCVVAFNWTHERDALCRLASKAKISYGVIDGSVPMARREEIVNDFQAGKLRVIFAHPQSAGHGLTLTRGTTTIWCSPTYNAEHFQQFNRRIYRRGQTKRTETICICANGTKEEEVYEKLDDKLMKMETLLGLFADITRSQEKAA